MGLSADHVRDEFGIWKCNTKIFRHVVNQNGK